MKFNTLTATGNHVKEEYFDIMQYKQKIVGFLKAWTLPVSMTTGFLGYVIYSNLHFLDGTHHAVRSAVGFIQPVLIFLMLFVTFCKVNPRELRLQKWHLWLVLIQVGVFMLLSGLLLLFPDTSMRVVIESAMICMITPTATAAAVITDKLGGNAATITTYNIIANVVTAIAAPLVFPMVHPVVGQTFLGSFSLILSKVFPLLICPFFAAVLVQRYMPTLLRHILSIRDLAFYLWAVALALAIAVTTHTLFTSQTALIIDISIALVSLVFCLLQFYFGRKIGGISGDKVTSGQALGQKNTILAIWMGYTFLSPITALAGGFYSVWHNVVNSYQLYKSKQN